MLVRRTDLRKKNRPHCNTMKNKPKLTRRSTRFLCIYVFTFNLILLSSINNNDLRCNKFKNESMLPILRQQDCNNSYKISTIVKIKYVLFHNII